MEAPRDYSHLSLDRPDVRHIFWIRNPRDCVIGSHITDDLSDWDVACPPTHDTRLRRAISWKYQYDLVRATPRPRNWIEVRFEDFVQRQDKTLARLESCLGVKLARIPVKPEAVGRFELGRNGHRVETAEVPLQPAQPANVSGDETGRLVHRLRRQQISRDVQRFAHPYAAGRQCVQHGSRAGVTPSDDCRQHRWNLTDLVTCRVPAQHHRHMSSRHPPTWAMRRAIHST